MDFAASIAQAPNRGMRFQRIAAVLEAVRASAGIAQCGLALILPAIQAGTVSLPFPKSCGTWTVHAFQARLRPEALLRPQVRRFKDWLSAEAKQTARELEQWVDRKRPK